MESNSYRVETGLSHVQVGEPLIGLPSVAWRQSVLRERPVLLLQVGVCKVCRVFSGQRERRIDIQLSGGRFS